MRENNLLILGASSALGTGLLQQEASRFDHIVVHDRAESALLAELRETSGGKIQFVQADLLQAEEVTAMIQTVQSLPFTINHILHLPSPPVENLRFKKVKWESVQRHIDISVRSAFLVMQAFLPAMAKAEYGKVVCVLSSCTCHIPPKYWCDYVTAKYALLGLMQALAAEYAGNRVNINGVSPSMLETRFLEKIPSLMVEQSAAQNPMKRNARVEDVIPMISYLLSDRADFITGQNFLISGGE